MTSYGGYGTFPFLSYNVSIFMASQVLSHGILVKSGNARMATMGYLAGSRKQSTVLTASLLRTLRHLDLDVNSKDLLEQVQSCWIDKE